MARAIARIDLGAVERNCARLVSELSEGAELCAVVKADGYGHGADACAGAALAGGASRLAVATGAEAVQIGRRFPQIPLLTMGALSLEDVEDALAAGSEVAVWRDGFREMLSARGRAQGRPVRVHVKYDSGMGRLGNSDPAQVVALARACAADPQLELAGVWTHFATADEPESDFFTRQLDRFAALAAEVKAEFPGVVAHAANSAAVFRDPRSHFDMARCGVAVYGLDPFQGDPARRGLEPAMSLRSYVADVKRFAAGDSAGYGQTWRAPVDTWVAVLPLGYGDGVRRALSNNA
jgi:alanine racemase